MGYSTRLTGAYELSRELTFHEIKLIEPAPNSLVDLELVHVEEGHPLGTLHRTFSEAIVPSYEDPVKAYDLIDHIQTLLDQLPGDVSVTGEIHGKGEEVGDYRRYVIVENRRVKELKARLVWPDGYELDPDAHTPDTLGIRF